MLDRSASWGVFMLKKKSGKSLFPQVIIKSWSLLLTRPDIYYLRLRLLDIFYRQLNSA